MSKSFDSHGTLWRAAALVSDRFKSFNQDVEEPWEVCEVKTWHGEPWEVWEVKTWHGLENCLTSTKVEFAKILRNTGMMRSFGSGRHKMLWSTQCCRASFEVGWVKQGVEDHEQVLNVKTWYVFKVCELDDPGMSMGSSTYDHFKLLWLGSRWGHILSKSWSSVARILVQIIHFISEEYTYVNLLLCQQLCRHANVSANMLYPLD